MTAPRMEKNDPLDHWGGVDWPGPWRERAACRGMAVDVFFPERGERTDAAKRVCRDCPVLADCWEYGVRWERVLPGIFGGLSGLERRDEARRRRRARRSAA